MPRGDDITARYSLDVSEFKQGIKEANESIRLANAQFRASTASMDDWSKSTDGVRAKLNQLGTILTAENKKLENYKKEQQEISRAYQENGRRADELRARLQELANNGVSRTSEEYRRYSQALNQVEREQQANQRAFEAMNVTILNQQANISRTEREINQYTNLLNDLQNEATRTNTAFNRLQEQISRQENELNTLRRAYANVVLEQGETSTEAQQLATRISQLNQDLNQNRTRLQNAQSAANNLTGSLNDTGDSAKDSGDGFTIMKGALASLVADGIKSVIGALGDLIIEVSKAESKFQAMTGVTTQEMENFDAQMQELYNKNYGESLQDVGDKMAYIMQVTKEVDPTKIKELTENAMTLEDTFGSDFNETIRGVSNLMNHFGIDSETAFDLFAKGSQLGLDYTSELGDNIAEYGGNFQQAGYTADEYFQLLVNGSKGGAYNLDKVNDSINEVKNRLGDGTIEKNLNIFSKETQNAFNEWQNGNGTMKGVIDSIVKDIANCTNEQDKLTMAATAFGTMGEDANLKVVESLTTVGDDFKDVKGTMESVKDVRYDDIGSSLSELGRTLKSELLQPIVDTIEPVIKSFVNWILDNLPIVEPIIVGLATAFVTLAGALAIQGIITGVTKAMSLLNTTMLANPITWVVVAIAGLVAAFVTLWNKSEAFRNFWIGLWENIKIVAQAVWEAITGFFSSAWETIQSIWNGVGDFFSSIWEGIKTILEPIAQWFYDVVIAPIEQRIQFVVLAFTVAWELVSQLAKSAWELILSVWQVVSDWFNSNVIQPVINFFKNAWELISQLAETCWKVIQTAWSIVSNWFNNNVIQPISNFFKTAWELISKLAEGCWKAIQTVWSTVSAWFNDNIIQPVINFFTNLWNNITTAAKTAWDFISNGATNAWNTITGLFSSVGGWFRDRFQEAWNNITSIFGNIGTFFGGLWNTIKDKFSALGTHIGDAISGAVKSGINGVISMVENAINRAISIINGAIGLVNKIPRRECRYYWKC